MVKRQKGRVQDRQGDGDTIGRIPERQAGAQRYVYGCRRVFDLRAGQARFVSCRTKSACPYSSSSDPSSAVPNSVPVWAAALEIYPEVVDTACG